MLKKSNSLGERDSLSVRESEVIIELGGEGGSITLSGFRTERGWSFSRALTDWRRSLSTRSAFRASRPSLTPGKLL